MAISYKEAGVDIEKGDLFVEKIKGLIGSTYDQNVLAGAGGFAALYKLDDNRMLATGTDGVGTKLKLAIDLNIHNTIGIDLVAMSINDVICTGARPLFFLDYLACHSVNLETHSEIVKGIANGCKESGCALIGGETAEMSDLYQPNHYDLAGFAVGEIDTDNLIDGSLIRDGHTLIALPSSGFHSNGYSLIRKVIQDDEIELKKKCLTPTKIYAKTINSLNKNANLISGIANITGGGFSNIERMNKDYGYKITNYIPTEVIPEEISIICERTGLNKEDLYQTFNMGVGMVLATDNPDELQQQLSNMNELSYVIGKVDNNISGYKLT